MSDELQMTDAVRMERAIIRIALLLAPDDAAVGVNFDELPGQVQALVADRDRLREQVQGGRRLRFKLAGRNTRLRGVIEDAVAVFGAEEMDYDAWTEALGRMRRSLDVDDALNFGVEGGEVAGPTSPEYDAVVNQLMDVADERDRLQAAIKAHHFDVAHTASKGIGVRASDHALYREAGLPDVGEADKETGAEFIARMEAIEAERDRLRAIAEAARRWRISYDRPLAELSPQGDREHLEALDALLTALDQLDGTGITGAGGEPDDEALAVYIRRVLARSGVEVRPCPDCGQWIFINDNGGCNDPAMTDGHECDMSSAGGAS